jgi:hypothetical protein
VARQPPPLKIVKDPTVPQIELDCDDVLLNFDTSESQLLRKDKTDDSVVLMKLFVHRLTPKDGIAADLTASTCISHQHFSLAQFFNFETLF